VAQRTIDREQGISKAGNRRLRDIMIELAWLWVRHQPDSALSRWFRARVGTERGRIRRIAIVALARKLLKAYWEDFIVHLKEITGKRLKGRLGGGAGYTVRTDDLMAEAGCLYHTSWIIDDQPWPINVRGGQKFIFVPYTGQTNDAGMLAWNREADYFQQMIKDQFETLYREGAENGRVMCLALHAHNIGRRGRARRQASVSISRRSRLGNNSPRFSSTGTRQRRDGR
jgi:hypothetical protein